MTLTAASLTTLADHDLLAAVRQLSADERRATAALIASLGELDVRRLYLGEGCSSLFTYCTQVLHLSEHAAYHRIEAARVSRRFPAILERLARGELTLTNIGLLAAHLTPDNHQQLLDAARHKTKREVEHLVATLCPRPDVPPAIRKLPAPGPRSESRTVAERPDTMSKAARLPSLSPAPEPSAKPAVVAPTASERYKVQFTASAATIEKLHRAQDLLRHTIPTGDPAAVIDRALTVLLDHLTKAKLAATKAPRAARPASHRSRHIPAAVRRAVWTRDEGRCAFVGAQGRCTERGFLELHHVVPYAAGGEATVDTISLRCRAHNQYEAQLDFPIEQPLFGRASGLSSG